MNHQMEAIGMEMFVVSKIKGPIRGQLGCMSRSIVKVAMDN